MNKVLNCGSLNYDRVYVVEHFVREEETILCKRYGEFIGGKGLNQSLALARAGAEVSHLGAVGKDGDMLEASLSEAGANTSFLHKVETVSGHAVIQRENGQNCIIVYGGANQSISKKMIDEAVQHFNKEDYLLLQNEISNLDYALQTAAQKGMKIVLNPSPITEGLLQCPLDLVDLFVLNEVEGKALSGELSDDYDIILQALAEKYPKAEIVLTIGAKGVLYQGKGEKTACSSFPEKVVDTTAAGDTFCGYYLACQCKGYSVEESLYYASMASGYAVSKEGAAPSIPTWHEMKKYEEDYKRRKSG